MCERTANCYRRSKTIQEQDVSAALYRTIYTRWIYDLRTWNERKQGWCNPIGLLRVSISSRDVFKVNFVRTLRSYARTDCRV